MGRIKAVIFDLDGVLIDAKEWHYDAMNRALAHYGFSIPRFEHVTIYDGLPTRKKLQLLTRRNNFPQRLHEAVSKLKQHYTMEIASEQCGPCRSHQDMLAWLSKAGFSLCVASNSIRATVNVTLKKAGLLQYFAFTLSNQDVTHPKPHPEIYLTAITRLRLKPEECVVVEDHPYGLDAARHSGAHVMQVKTVDEVCRSRISEFISGLEKQTAVVFPFAKGGRGASSAATTLCKAG